LLRDAVTPEASIDGGLLDASPDAADWPSDACATVCNATWTPLALDHPTELGERIIARGAVAVYDSFDQQMILTHAPGNVVWQLPFRGGSAEHFAILAADGEVPPPDIIGGDYDSHRNRLVVFTADRGFYALDLSASTWRRLATNELPITLGFAIFSYLPRNDLFMIAAPDTSDYANGRPHLFLTPADSLEWRAVGNPPLLGAGPPYLWSGHTINAARDRFYWFLHKAYAFALDPSPTWSRLPDMPETGFTYSAVFDLPADRAIVFGGSLPLVSLSFSSTPSWSALVADDEIPSRVGHHAVFDGDRRRMLVFGGQDIDAHNEPQPTWHNGVESLSLTSTPSWSEVVPDIPEPVSDESPFGTATYDSLRNAIVLLPSRNDYLDAAFETWRLPLSPVARWERISTSSTPSARSNPAFVYQPDRDRFVLFGGNGFCLPVGCANPIFDSWTLELSPSPVWRRLATAGTPPPGDILGAFLVGAPSSMLVIGRGRTDAMRVALFQLTLGDAPTWSDLTAEDAPSLLPLWAAPTAFAVDARVLLLATVPASETATIGAWLLHLEQQPLRWSPVNLNGDVPTSALSIATVAYDESSSAFVLIRSFPNGQVFGCGGGLEQVWELPLDSPDRWRRIGGQGARPDQVWGPLLSTPSGLIAFAPSAWRISIDRCP
jgi:hypothetical protein